LPLHLGNILPWNEEGSSAAPSVLPTITITRLSDTQVRVDFSAPVLLLPTLTWPGAYAFAPSLSVLSVTPGPITELGTYDSVEYVTVNTLEQSPALYTVTVFGLEVA
jgi:hypothetical protein